MGFYVRSEKLTCGNMDWCEEFSLWTSSLSCVSCVKAGAAPWSVLLPRKLPLCLAGPGILAWRNCRNAMLQMVCVIHPSKTPEWAVLQVYFFLQITVILHVILKLFQVVYKIIQYLSSFSADARLLPSAACVIVAISTAATPHVQPCAQSTVTDTTTRLTAWSMTTTQTVKSICSKWAYSL